MDTAAGTAVTAGKLAVAVQVMDQLGGIDHGTQRAGAGIGAAGYRELGPGHACRKDESQ